MTRLFQIAAVLILSLVAFGLYRFAKRSSRPHSALASASAARPRAATRPATEPKVPEAAPAAPSSSAKPAPEAPAGISLRSGEVLRFTADVAKFSNVADLTLQVMEHRNFFGKSAWHLQAVAHTENPLRMVFELDDQFDSYSDAASLSSLQYEMHLSERGQKVDSIQRMTSSGKDPAVPPATQARVLPGTRDPLGMMQYLRSLDWSKPREVRGPVYDGHKLYEVSATLASPSQTVSVPAGQFDASKIEIRVFENGSELKDAHFFLYLDHSEKRTPVLLEAVMPFATARVALKSVQ